MTELRVNAYAGLCEQLVGGGDAANPRDRRSQFRSMARSFRRWSLSKPDEFGLLYNSPAPGEDNWSGPVFVERARAGSIVGSVIEKALATGQVIGSLGTGWGFYLLGEYPEQGVSVLATTTIGTLLFILFVTWLLATHHSGENLFLWARDVDPVAAREQLRKARTATQWSVFERVDLLAARHAYEVGHGLTPASQVTWFDAQRTALRYHWRLMATLLLPTVLWIGRQAFSSDPSLSLMAWLGASILVVPLGVASTFQLTVTTHQGWAARERVLTSRIGHEGEPSRWRQALAVLLASK